MDYVILHFVGITGEGEKIVIVEAPVEEEDRVPPIGFKLAGEHPADIERGEELPLTYILERR